jgi:hypothetical protein
VFRVVARWDAINDTLHVLTFVLNVWVLAEVFANGSRPAERSLAQETVRLARQ